MKTRILSALIMLPFLGVLFLGGKWLLIACFAIAVIGVREFYQGFRAMSVDPCTPIGYGAALVLYGIGLFTLDLGYLGQDRIWYMLWAFASVLASLLYLFRIDVRKPVDAMATITGIFYVIFFSYHVVLTNYYYDKAVWFILLSAFGTDIMAYFTGMALGKHKLCPKISPKKTVEGAVGGVLGSVLFCMIFAWLVMPEHLLLAALIGIAGSVVSQFGDLTASIFKRHMGIKDYGKLIPGHGGIMDRFDSVLFTAPMVYYLMVIMEMIG